MTSIDSNSNTSLRRYYLLYQKIRWPTKKKKKNIIKDFVSHKKERQRVAFY